ncbi:hypothetical protein GOP47_0028070 [Adiantum capillus-veneris]|nr:hypothetical protein GOP47_0028070 [Adiantum capillus-veneris]
MGKMREKMRDHLRSLSLVLSLIALSITVGHVHASPIFTIPDLATASSVGGPPLTLSFNCCLPLTSTPIKDFSFEKYKPKRKLIRRPALTWSEEYIAYQDLPFESSSHAAIKIKKLHS